MLLKINFVSIEKVWLVSSNCSLGRPIVIDLLTKLKSNLNRVSFIITCCWWSRVAGTVMHTLLLTTDANSRSTNLSLTTFLYTTVIYRLQTTCRAVG